MAVGANEQSANETLTIHGSVVAEGETPVANAVVACWCRQFDSSTAFVGKTFTDRNGHYSIDARRIREIARLHDHVPDEIMRQSRDEQRRRGLFHIAAIGSLREHGLPVTLVAFDENDALGWANPQVVLSSTQIELDIRLRDQSGIVAGRVVDKDGEPVADQSVRLTNLYDHADSAVQHSSTEFCFDWTAKTDRKGRFVFSRLPGGMLATAILVDRTGKSRSLAGLWTTPGMMADRVRAGHYSSNPCTLSTTEPANYSVDGRLMNSDGQPIVGAIVSGKECETTTHEEGVYRIQLPVSTPVLTFAFPQHERFRSFILHAVRIEVL